MTRNDIRVQFNKDKDLHVLQTEGTGYIHYTDDYVHWLEDIALKQANGVNTGDDKCHIQRVSNLAKFCEKISQQEDCPPEFIEIVNKEFWNLI